MSELGPPPATDDPSSSHPRFFFPHIRHFTRATTRIRAFSTEHHRAPLSLYNPQMRPDRPRSPLAGPSSGPAPPFPIQISGPIVKGFGRGSKELGIPTANIPLAGLSVGGHEEVESGVYYGWAGVNVDEEGARVEQREGRGGGVWPMVMSIGFNPYYNNTVRSVEVHILHSFHHDFYGARMNLLIMGFIRPEYDYVSKESLVEDIRFDIEVARRSLEREAYEKWKGDDYLTKFEGQGHENTVAT